MLKTVCKILKIFNLCHSTSSPNKCIGLWLISPWYHYLDDFPFQHGIANNTVDNSEGLKIIFIWIAVTKTA